VSQREPERAVDREKSYETREETREAKGCPGIPVLFHLQQNYADFGVGIFVAL
jgi:hypothetical protein